MKAGAKTYLLLGVLGSFVSLTKLVALLSGQGNVLDILGAIFFAFLSADGFVSYLRLKGKTQVRLIFR